MAKLFLAAVSVSCITVEVPGLHGKSPIMPIPGVPNPCKHKRVQQKHHLRMNILSKAQNVFNSTMTIGFAGQKNSIEIRMHDLLHIFLTMFFSEFWGRGTPMLGISLVSFPDLLTRTAQNQHPSSKICRVDLNV